jgi:hypothetical protein
LLKNFTIYFKEALYKIIPPRVNSHERKFLRSPPWSNLRLKANSPKEKTTTRCRFFFDFIWVFWYYCKVYLTAREREKLMAKYFDVVRKGTRGNPRQFRHRFWKETAHSNVTQIEFVPANDTSSPAPAKGDPWPRAWTHHRGGSLHPSLVFIQR